MSSAHPPPAALGPRIPASRTARSAGLIASLVLMLLPALALAASPRLGERATTFEDVAARVAQAGTSGPRRLALSTTPEGHLKLANRAGERMTAASPEELARALAILMPGAANDPAPVEILAAEELLYRDTTLVPRLPADAVLRVLIGGEAVPVERTGTGGTTHLRVALRPGLLVEARERAALRELERQLDRPLDPAAIRVVAMEGNGPAFFTPRPGDRADKQGRNIDRIDPARLTGALHALARQTVIVTGRPNGETIEVRPSSGTATHVPRAALVKAARAADIDLLIVTTASGRQPGGRNWLWQRIAVSHLDKALKRATLADFIAALGGGQPMRLTIAQGQDGVTLSGTTTRAGGPSSWTAPVSEIIGDLTTQTLGSLEPTGLEASLVTSERRRELAWRAVPGIPSVLQIGYAVLLIAGLAGLPAARGWWRRLWPRERRAEYAGAGGYWAARGVRGLAFVALFMPLVAPLSVPATLLRLARRTPAAKHSAS